MLRFCRVLFFFFIFPIKANSQLIVEEIQKNVNFKTNILLVKNVSQISLGLEIRSKKKANVSNSFSIVRNRVLTNIENSYTGKTEIDQLRKSFDLKYNRRFYFFESDMSSRHSLFHSPYASLRFRDVYQKGSDSWLFPQVGRNFTSSSLVIGEDLGFILLNYKNKINLEIVGGAGVGKVIQYDAKSNDIPTSFHPDFHFLLNLGIFIK